MLGMIRIAGIAATLSLVGCAQPGYESAPWLRHLGWFRTVLGQDLIATCTTDTPRLRAIYNGRYDTQIRQYDLTPTATGAWQLATMVRGTTNVLTLDSRDLAQPWRGRTTERTVGAEDRQRIIAALDATPDPVASGTNLPSDRLYWIVTECRDGKVHTRAWLLDDSRPQQPAFVAVLRALDPDETPLEDRPMFGNSRDRREGRFMIEVP